MESILDVEGLEVTLETESGARRPLVTGVSFSVQPREVVAIVGPSGSGKSLTVRAMLGLTEPPLDVAGVVRYGVHDIVGEPDHLAMVRGKTVGYVPQEPATALSPVFTIGDQLVEVLRTRSSMSASAARQEAAEWLTRLGVDDAAKRLRTFPHQLSGGQRQRVLLAMALARRPQLLVADEPTSAVDATTQSEIVHLLEDVRRSDRLAMVLVTHDLRFVAGLAQRVVVLDAGRMVESGNADRVLACPAHPTTQALVQAWRKAT